MHTWKTLKGTQKIPSRVFWALALCRKKDKCRTSYVLPFFRLGAREPLLPGPRLSRRHSSELGTQTSSRVQTLSPGTSEMNFVPQLDDIYCHLLANPG